MGKENIYKAYSFAENQRHMLPWREVLINPTEIEVFQNSLVSLLGESKEGKQLHDQDLSWGGFENNGIRFQDLQPGEQRAMIQLVGPGIVKMVRFTPTMPLLLQKAHEGKLDVITVGGSCLVSAADSHTHRGENKITQDFLDGLPSLMQIVDSIIPIRSAHAIGNIVEDVLFYERFMEWTGQNFLAELGDIGHRVEVGISLLSKLHGAQKHVFALNFSEMDVAAHTHKFLESPAFTSCVGSILMQGAYDNVSVKEAIEAFKTMGRSVFLFSYTGDWADLIRHKAIESGAVTGQKPVAVVSVEPYHHFLEIAANTIAVPEGNLSHLLNEAFGLFYRTHPFGTSGSANEAMSGAMGFIPWIVSNGLGHDHLTAQELPTYGNEGKVALQLIQDTLMLDADPDKPCVTPHNDPILFAGINWLYHNGQSRKAVQELVLVDAEIKAATSDKHARKELRKDPQFKLRVALAHEVLAERAIWILEYLGITGDFESEKP